MSAYLQAMCGRYDNLIPRDAYSALFRAARIPRSNFPPRYNIAPTDQIPIVRVDPRDGERELVMARWGLIPFWMKEKPKVPHINARAETVHKLHFSVRRLQNAAASSQPLAFMSGNSAMMGNSHIAFVARISNPSPLRASGSSTGSPARRSYQPR